jgi:hypothetical protein
MAELSKVYFLENYTGTNAWQCYYIRGKCSFVCRTKHSRKTSALWGTNFCLNVLYYSRGIVQSNVVMTNIKRLDQGQGLVW